MDAARSGPEDVRREFLRVLGPGLHGAELFDSLPEVYFYAKDSAGRIVAANRALVALRGSSDEGELIGRTDFDLHPRHLAERYVAEDRTVMSSGRPVSNQVWLIPDESGRLRWYLSSKVPLFGSDGRAVGLAGTFRDLHKFEAAHRPFRAMDAVLRRVLDGYPGRIEVRELADLAGLSPSQFDRRFKALFGITPREYVLRVRTDAAAHAIATTDRPIGDIALDCGFYDQSSFGKQFRRRMGMTPLNYRRRYSASGFGEMLSAGRS